VENQQIWCQQYYESKSKEETQEWFFLKKFYTSFVVLIPKHFVIFDAILNGIVFLISFLDCSLLVYRNISGFNILIYPAALLHSLISPSSFVCV